MFKSRFGYHSCSYEIYKKLKELNKMLTKAVHLRNNWLRWHNKLPHNRVIRTKIRNSKNQVIGFGPAIPRPEPDWDNIFLEKVNGVVQLVNHQFIAEDYRKARMPKALDDVEKLSLQESKIESYFM